MHVKIEDWENGWSGISVGLDPDEIDHFIELLKMIKDDPDQHFHISSDYEGTGGVGDIEISIRSESEEHNMDFSGPALAPGESIDI
ncbi:MAG: hypothetical protein QY327_10480 [Fimbriimonadaceae bacterium]|nr:MAG: hypothetical protein UZ18_ATM001000964 [Armatimonadetes bacterium OLB18]MBV6491211.1 hypothetical protein [Fimbriimonadaceae bacterium]QOJ11707.1 MAG: hypothetical protein HRU74_06430 [Chthonomonadaceae bacterium]MCC6352108.1 hypothetical protein [Fimbriimonadaceae bacterium]MCL4285371.1 hypothetical protein [Fimbriimonadaceae bacterium]